MFRRRFLLILTLLAGAAGLAWCTNGRDQLAASGQTLGSSGLSALGALRARAERLWDGVFGGDAPQSGAGGGWSGAGGSAQSPSPGAQGYGPQSYAAPSFGAGGGGSEGGSGGFSGASAPQPARDSCLGALPPGVKAPFALTDQSGLPVTDASFLGRPMLIAFGFSFCRETCKASVQRLGEAAAALDAEGVAVTPVFITLDPERDSIPVLAAYVGHFHPRMVGLTGDLRETAAAAQTYQVYSRKRLDSAAPGGYTLDHTNAAFYVDAQGFLRARFPEGASARDIAGGVLCRMKNG